MQLTEFVVLLTNINQLFKESMPHTNCESCYVSRGLEETLFAMSTLYRVPTAQGKQGK